MLSSFNAENFFRLKTAALILLLLHQYSLLQCFDAVGWVTGKASGPTFLKVPTNILGTFHTLGKAWERRQLRKHLRKNLRKIVRNALTLT